MCELCRDTGIWDTGNNELPCPNCPELADSPCPSQRGQRYWPTPPRKEALLRMDERQVCKAFRPRRDGSLGFLFHGHEGSRTVPRGTWLRARARWVRNGRGRKYRAGFHCFRPSPWRSGGGSASWASTRTWHGYCSVPWCL